MMRNGKRYLLLTLSGLMLPFLLSCGSDEGIGNVDGSSQEQTVVATVEEHAGALDPSAVEFSVYDMDGKLRHSSEWVGQSPVVINFWGTWCAPCRREIPDLVRIYNEYKDQDIELISMSLRDSPQMVKAYAEANNMNWPMLIGTERVVTQYGGMTGVPTTVFLDRTGRELGRFIGPRPYEVFKQAFEAVIKAS